MTETHEWLHGPPRWIFIIKWVLIIIAVVAVYAFADSYNLIPHSREARIAVAPNWMIGERKTCYALDLASPRFPVLTCEGGGEDKVFKVTFHGSMDHMTKESTWFCTRKTIGMFNDDAFSCEWW